MNLIKKLIQRTKTYRQLENGKLMSQQELIDQANGVLKYYDLSFSINMPGHYRLLVVQSLDGPKIQLQRIS